jgi:hypothetical protein
MKIEKVIKWVTNSVNTTTRYVIKWGETSPKITKIGTKQCFVIKRGTLCTSQEV